MSIQWIVAFAFLAACQSGTSRKEKSEAAQPPTFVHGPTGGAPIAPFVQAELTRSARRERDVLVYVGAVWCEPCKHFHDAVDSGRLDETLSGLRLVEFDLDADRDALDRAGYASKMIPLFAVPAPDGRGSPRRFAGSVKGPAAVDRDMVPRVRNLLQRSQ